MTRDEWRKLLTSEVTLPYWPTVGRAFRISRCTADKLRREGRLPVRVLTLGNAFRVVSAELADALGINLDEPHSDRTGPPLKAVRDAS